MKSVHRLRAYSVLIFFFLGLETAFAGDAIVVALGASNTYGHWVARGEDYPAQLEQTRHAKGFKVSVVNAGVSGDTTWGMLSRLDGVTPEGTRVVILEPCCNDFTKGFGWQHASNVEEIKRRLAARRIALIMLKPMSRGKETVDGVRLTAAAYHQFAEEILPQVEQALRRN